MAADSRVKDLEAEVERLRAAQEMRVPAMPTAMMDENRDLRDEVERLRVERDEARAERRRAEHLWQITEARLAKVVTALRTTARILRAQDGLPCYCDDYEARKRAGYGHARKCEYARATLADAQPEEEEK